MKQSDLHKFRLILTDGEDTFQLAVFNDSKTGTALNEKFSIITIADSQSRVFKYENRFTLLLDDFTVVKEGRDIGRALIRSISTKDSQSV